MKKRLMLLGCICALSLSSALAYETTYVDGENFTHQFDIYKPGESLDYLGELTSTREIDANTKKSLNAAANWWASVINATPDKPVRYAVIPYDDYGAGSASLPVKITNSPYFVSEVNAIINNLNIEKTYTDLQASSKHLLLMAVETVLAYS